MKKSGNEKSCNSFCFLHFQLWLTTLANSEKIRTRFDRNIWISFLVQQPLPAMPFEPSVIRSLHSHFASGTTWSSTRRTWRKAWARLTLQPFAIPSWVNPGCMPRSSVTLAHSTLPALDGQFTTSGAILHKVWDAHLNNDKKLINLNCWLKLMATVQWIMLNSEVSIQANRST